MPKSKKRYTCCECGRTIAASVAVNHVRTRHAMLYEQLVHEYEMFIQQNATICPCGNEVKKRPNAFNMWFFAVKVMNDPTLAVYQTCGLTCKKLLSVWNKGLTKSMHPALMKMSIDRMGSGNPIHSVVADASKYASWISALKKADVSKRIRGKTYDEVYGSERAMMFKAKMSSAARKRLVHGHTGHHHSEETKRLIAIKTIENLKTRKNVTSIPQRMLFDELVVLLGSERVMLEKQVAWYSIDIVIDGYVDVEVDGDFYHVNEEKGYKVQYDVQRRNKKNDSRRDAYFLNRGWKVIRVWESDIHDDVCLIAKKIVEMINVDR